MISKAQIHSAFLDLLEQKIAAIKVELNQIKESANSETKSSMGDKYETSREMMMQERSRLESQMEVFVDQIAALNSIDVEKDYSQITYGCLVETGEALFFISAAIGLLKVNSVTVFAISGEAPFAKAMKGKKQGDSFSFNNKSFHIKSLA